jgi:hypothetical protein
MPLWAANSGGGPDSTLVSLRFGGWHQLGSRPLALSAWRSLLGALWLALSGWRSLVGALCLALSAWLSRFGGWHQLDGSEAAPVAPGACQRPNALPPATRWMPLWAANSGGGPDSPLVSLRFGGWHQLDGSEAAPVAPGACQRPNALSPATRFVPLWGATSGGGPDSTLVSTRFGGWHQLGSRPLALSGWRSLAGALWLALSGWRSLVNALSGAPAALTPFVEFGSLNLRFSYGHGLCLSCLDTWRSLCGALCLALSAWLSSLRLRSWSDRGWRLPDSPTVIRDVLAEPRGLTSGALQPSSPFAVGNTSSPPCAVLHNRRSVL